MKAPGPRSSARQAAATSSRLLAQRYKPLSEARAVSQQDYDNAVASQDQAAADVASAKAALETARINLAYTKMFAPISGRTGRSSVTEGALVSANQTNALVVIQQLDPIYVDATQASTVLLAFAAGIRGRTTEEGRRLASGSQIDFRGRLAVSADAASCNFPKSRSIRAPDQSRCARSFPIRKAPCCPACSCASAWRKESTRKACSSRSARSATTNGARPRSRSSALTTRRQCASSKPTAPSAISGW